MIKINFCKCLCLLLFAVVANAVLASDYKEGLVSNIGDGAIYFYTLGKVEKNQEVVYQYADEKGMVICCKSTLSDGIVRTLKDNPVMDGESDREVHAYRLTAPRKGYDYSLFVGAAVVARKENVQGTQSKLNVKDGQTSYVLKTCVGYEGTHLLRIENGKLAGHLYYNEGYDIEPSAVTCKKHELGSK